MTTEDHRNNRPKPTNSLEQAIYDTALEARANAEKSTDGSVRAWIFYLEEKLKVEIAGGYMLNDAELASLAEYYGVQMRREKEDRKQERGE